MSFPQDSPVLNVDAEPTIAALANGMNKHPKSQIKILGFANDGIKIPNPSLALKRAFAIKLKLQAKGIKESRIDFGTGGVTANKIQMKVVAK